MIFGGRAATEDGALMLLGHDLIGMQRWTSRHEGPEG